MISWEEFVIKRPENLDYSPIDLFFNNDWFECLEIDLEHINKKGRSQFSAGDIAKVVKDVCENKILEPCGEAYYENEKCIYFEQVVFLHKVPHRLIMCICSDRLRNIGIISFYRVRLYESL